MSLLSPYYCLRSVYDGYESLQLLEQNGGFGNNSGQIPSQINNIHNAGEYSAELQFTELGNRSVYRINLD